MTGRRQPADHPDLRAMEMWCRVPFGDTDRILFVVVVVKGLGGFCSPAARDGPVWAVRWRVGWAEAREWLVRRAGVRGVSRPPWRQSGSPVALPGPSRMRPGGRRRAAGRRWRR
jgi:hypothetical protein